MAFSFNNNSQSQQQQDPNWKAAAFLNIWIKKSDGSRAKIGAIPLKDSRNFDKALIARLQEDGAVDALAQALELDFQMADQPNRQVDVGF